MCNKIRLQISLRLLLIFVNKTTKRLSVVLLEKIERIKIYSEKEHHAIFYIDLICHIVVI